MTQAVALPPVAAAITIDTRVGQYVSLRDKIAEMNKLHKEAMEPLNETLMLLNDDLLRRLQVQGADSVATGSGTVYRTEKKSASIKDMAAFWTYCVTAADFDLIDKKANVPAVEKFIEENKITPPGVEYKSRYVVGVRRK